MLNKFFIKYFYWRQEIIQIRKKEKRKKRTNFWFTLIFSNIQITQVYFQIYKNIKETFEYTLCCIIKSVSKSNLRFFRKNDFQEEGFALRNSPSSFLKYITLFRRYFPFQIFKFPTARIISHREIYRLVQRNLFTKKRKDDNSLEKRQQHTHPVYFLIYTERQNLRS